MTSAKALADTERFIETLREGQQRALEQGRASSPDLADFFQQADRWLRARRAQDEALKRARDADD